MSNAALFLQDPVSQEEMLLNVISTEASIGKSRGADVILGDLRCSDIHAFIIQQKDSKKFKLLDLGSHSGTFVDGERIIEKDIESGDVFVIGNSRIRIKTLPKALADFGVLGKKVETDVVGKASQKLDAALITEKNLLQVTMYWGQQILDIRTFETDSAITIGSTTKATFGVTLPEHNIFKIAHYSKGLVNLYLPKDAEGLIWLGQDTFTVRQLAERNITEENGKDLSLTLRVGDRADVQIGELTLSFRFVVPPEKVKRFVVPKIDKKLLQILGGLLGFYLLFFLILSISSTDPEKKEKKEIPEKLKRVLFKAGVESATKRRQSAVGAITNEQGGRARAEEGASKAKKAPEVQKASVKKAQQVTNKKSETVAKKVDLDSAFSKDTNKSVVDEIARKGPVTSGNTVSAIAKGGFARGNSGLGAGGGGQSVGIGQLKGVTTGGGGGAGDMGLLASKGREIDVPEADNIVVLGGLDADVIAAVIKRYLPQIQHCYETQLVRTPDLKGKVLVGFQIIADGSVKNPLVLESSLKNKPVEKCILSKVKKWTFPKPKGGGVVGVKYPFLLMSTNEE